MNKKAKTIALFLLAGFIVPAIAGNKPAVIFSEKTQKYIKKYTEDGNFNKHRSGLLGDKEEERLFEQDGKDKVLKEEGDSPNQKNISKKRWKTARDNEYEILYVVPGKKLLLRLKKALKKAGLTSYSYDHENHEMLFENDSSSEDDGLKILYNIQDALEEKVLIKKGKNYLRKLLKAFRGRIEYECSDIDYFSSANADNEQEKNEEILNVHLRFRRIFRGGIVLNNLSYLILAVSKTGELRSVRIKWPRFKRIDNDSDIITIRTGKEELQKKCSELTELTDQSGNTLQIESYKFAGTSMAWCQVEGSDEYAGQNVLTPCYVFRANIQLSNGENLVKLFTVPRLNKYVE